MSDTRSLAARIAAVQRTTQAPPEQMAAAEQLLADMLAAAAQHGVTLDDSEQGPHLTNAPILDGGPQPLPAAGLRHAREGEQPLEPISHGTGPIGTPHPVRVPKVAL